MTRKTTFARIEAFSLGRAEHVVPENEGELDHRRHVKVWDQTLAQYLSAARDAVLVAGQRGSLLQKLMRGAARVRTPYMRRGRRLLRKQRSDTPVLLGVVYSHPDRWDECDPKELEQWIELVVRECNRLWPGLIEAVLLHIDEGHPHLHVLVHDEGRPVKPLHPGFRAGDSAHDRALETGYSKYRANGIRNEVHAEAMNAFHAFDYRCVGEPLGWLPAGPESRQRDSRAEALARQRLELVARPLDAARAEAAKRHLENRFRSHRLQLAPLSESGHSNVLDVIGFAEPKEFPAKPRERPRRDTKNLTVIRLREMLGKILDRRPSLLEFLNLCQASRIVVAPYFDRRGRATGISFGIGTRMCSGSTLGKRFAWPALSQCLAFDPQSLSHIAALHEAALATDAVHTGLECRLTPLREGGRKAPRRAKLPPALSVNNAVTAQEVADGFEYLWKKTKRAVIHEASRLITVLRPVAAILRLSIRIAKRKGWLRVKIEGPRGLLDEMREELQLAAKRARIELVIDETGVDVCEEVAQARKRSRLTPRPVSGAPFSYAQEPATPDREEDVDQTSNPVGEVLIADDVPVGDDDHIDDGSHLRLPAERSGLPLASDPLIRAKPRRGP